MIEKQQTLEKEIKLNRSKLIESEIEGKILAISGYDSIIWKIRSGYVAILYGALTLLLGKSEIPDLNDLMTNIGRSISIFLLILGFSISVGIIDISYLKKKLKVIVARDILMEIVLDPKIESAKKINLKALLMVSGEIKINDLSNDSGIMFKEKLNWNLRWIIFPLYSTTPILFLVIYLIFYCLKLRIIS